MFDTCFSFDLINYIKVYVFIQFYLSIGRTVICPIGKSNDCGIFGKLIKCTNQI